MFCIFFGQMKKNVYLRSGNKNQMTMKIRNLFLTLAMTVSLTAAADDYAYLRVDGTDGENVFTVSQIDRITFDNQNMVLTLTDGTQNTLPLASLSRMFFTQSSETGISLVRNGGFRIENGVLYIDSKSGSQVTLYNIGGQVVRQFTTNADKAELNIGGLKQGVYIIKVNGQTQKFMHK